MTISDASNTEVWLFVIGTLAAIIGSLGLIILNQIRREIQGIKDDMKEGIRELNKEFRIGHNWLDRRVTNLEILLGKKEVNSHVEVR